MSLFSACKFALFLSLLFISSATMHVSCFQYQVGGERGWIRPDGSGYDTYNEWAKQHRFHIGDTLYFKYSNDSVLVVNSEDYAECAMNNPISKFEDGNTGFEFDRSGFYFFMSGQPGHCQVGQKMIVWVMGVHHHSTPSSGTPASSPAAEAPTGGWGWNADTWGPSQSQSQSQTNSTHSLSATSILLSMLMGVVILLYLFMQ